MAYMVWQRYTTAVKNAYRGHPDVERHHQAARSHRQWLESLEIDPEIRDVLVEQARVVEEAFGDLRRRG